LRAEQAALTAQHEKLDREIASLEGSLDPEARRILGPEA
jgi:uncharacterized protein YdcH (DUF465 family)